MKFGPLCSPDATPVPASHFHEGLVIDYAVVMRRLPDEATLEARVRAGTLSVTDLGDVARFIAAFHRTSASSEQIDHFGTLAVIGGNCEENFTQLQPYLGRTLDHATYDRIVDYTRRFMHARAVLFTRRIAEQRIRDCHGDLRLQHVYLLDEHIQATQGLPRIVVLDRIEFNERFRYSDVASEIAFLAMELDLVGRSDLARAFVTAYSEASGDEDLPELLPFYSCYRACVRGKVYSFQLDDLAIPEVQRQEATRTARTLLALAGRYAYSPTAPVVLLVGGLMGTGKSTLALALQQALGWAYLSSDIERKRLAQIDPAHPQAEQFGQGIYSAEWTRRTYEALQAQLARHLARNRSVIVDATFLRRADRLAMLHIANDHGTRPVFVECQCLRSIVLDRLGLRWQGRVEGHPLSEEGGARASDGRPELYDTQVALWESVEPDAEPGMEHVLVDTAAPASACQEQVLKRLGYVVDLLEESAPSYMGE